MKAKISILAVVILLLLAAWFGYRGFTAGNDRPQFRTLPVTRGEILIGVTATGTVEPVQIIDVGAQIVGMIKSFGPDANGPDKTIDFNSRVKEGDVLAQLDDRPHRVELEKAVAGLRLAEAELKQSRAQRDKAERDFHRAERLRGTNSVAEFEAATSQFEIAQAELAMCEAKVEQAKSMKKQAEINLDYTTIRSPVNGTVIARRVNAGQTVVAGLNAPSLFLLAKDLSRMQVFAAVNEADVGDIQLGQKVTFKVDTYRNRTFSGKVSQIRLDAAMSASVVTYCVVVDTDNSDGKLKPYMTAKLQFEVARRSNALLIAEQALRWRPTWEQITPSARAGLTPPVKLKLRRAEAADGEVETEEPTVDTGAPTAWVVADDGLVRPVPVKLGLSDNTDTELTGGELQAKDEVVIGAVRAARADFVSSFINRVVNKK
jgi:HlyD family secretion protein